MSAEKDTTAHVMFSKGHFKGFVSIGGHFEAGVSEQLKKNTNEHKQYYPKKHEHKQTRMNKYVF